MKLKIGDKEYPVRLTMGAMLRFHAETGLEVNEIGDSPSLMVTLLWCCLCSACAADGVECTLTVDEMADRLDPSVIYSFAGEMNRATEEGKKKSLTEEPPAQASKS